MAHTGGLGPADVAEQQEVALVDTGSSSASSPAIKVGILWILLIN
jgi:hypothetical protein